MQRRRAAPAVVRQRSFLRLPFRTRRAAAGTRIRISSSFSNTAHDEIDGEVDVVFDGGRLAFDDAVQDDVAHGGRDDDGQTLDVHLTDVAALDGLVDQAFELREVRLIGGVLL